MSNDDQDELLDILMTNNINALIQPGKEGPVLRIFYTYNLKDWDHKSLADKILGGMER